MTAESSRQRDIERSIIKTYRKSIWRPFTKALKEYKLISDGDKIAVCISGGKDSMLMAKCMQEIQKHGLMDFELLFLCMDPGYAPENRQLIEHNAEVLGIHGFYADPGTGRVSFDLLMDFSSASKDVYQHICDEVRQAHPDYTFDIVLDNDFSD